MSNGNSYQHFSFKCAFPRLLLAQLFKVQVNLSWWFSCMVRGGSLCEWSNEKWSVVEVAELDIRGKDIDWLRSTPYYGNTHT